MNLALRCSIMCLWCYSWRIIQLRLNPFIAKLCSQSRRTSLRGAHRTWDHQQWKSIHVCLILTTFCYHLRQCFVQKSDDTHLPISAIISARVTLNSQIHLHKSYMAIQSKEKVKASKEANAPHSFFQCTTKQKIISQQEVCLLQPSEP